MIRRKLGVYAVCLAAVVTMGMLKPQTADAAVQPQLTTQAYLVYLKPVNACTYYGSWSSNSTIKLVTNSSSTQCVYTAPGIWCATTSCGCDGKGAFYQQNSLGAVVKGTTRYYTCPPIYPYARWIYIQGLDVHNVWGDKVLYKGGTQA